MYLVSKNELTKFLRDVASKVTSISLVDESYSEQNVHHQLAQESQPFCGR